MQYVSVMINDGSQLYDQDHDGGDHKLAGCETSFRGAHAYARVIYSEDILRMYLDTSLTGEWEECFVIRQVCLRWRFVVIYYYCYDFH